MTGRLSRLSRAIALLLPAVSLGVMAQVAPLPINIDEADAPFMFAENGRPAGVYTHLLTAAFGHLGIPIILRPMPWKRALSEADAGIAGVAGIYKTEARLQKYDYSDVLFAERLVVYFSQSRPMPDFKSVADFKGLRVGIHRGWAYGEAFDAGLKAGLFTAEEVNSDVQNFMKLEQHRIDCLIVSAVPGAVLAPQYKVVLSPTPLSEGLTYLIFPKRMDKAAVLLQFNQVIKDMKKSGEFHQLVQASLR